MDMTGKRRGIMIKAGVPPIHELRMIPNDGTTRMPVRMSVGVGMYHGIRQALVRPEGLTDIRRERNENTVRLSLFLVPLALGVLLAPVTTLNNNPVDKFIDIIRGILIE
jgi:hypothetical protein